MEPNSLKWVGSACGLHGPYIFYKAFKFHLEGKPRILSLGDFFFVRCKPEDPICIAELQLLWEERTNKQLLSSSKLYFLPEDTPQGRTVSHGEDEIVAASEKVIVKLENLVKWAVSDFSEWTRGLRAVPLKPSLVKELGRNGQREALHKYRESTLNSALNFKDVLKEKAELGEDEERKRLVVLSYPQYCRYRSITARLREHPSHLLTDHVVLALGGITSLGRTTLILYCRETFDHPTLVDNESICDEFAPNLKGRPRKKKPSVSQRRDSQGPGSGKEASMAETKTPAKVKTESKALGAKPKNNSSCKKAPIDDKPKDGTGEECRADEQAFLVALYKYMKERKTPIERIPYLGFKQINLWTMFQAAQKLGGYDMITARRQWKNVYDELGGNPGSTSAATCTRRHYERLILPYERYFKGEEEKPLPPAKPRKPESGGQEGGCKAKAAVAKRPKGQQNQEAEDESDAPVKPLLMSDKKVEDLEAAEMKLEPQQAQQKLLTDEQKRGDMEEEELQLTVKEEASNIDFQEELPVLHALPFEKNPSEHLLGDSSLLQPPPGHLSEAVLNDVGSEPQEKNSSNLPIVAPKTPHHSHVQGQWLSGPSEHCTPCVCKVGPSVNKENQNHVVMVLPTLKQKQLQDPTATETMGTKEAVLESCFSYKSVLYPKGNPGIMSPLAKKKLLSQVSGTGLPNNYSFYPPLTLNSKKCVRNSPEEQNLLQAPQGSNKDTLAVYRPSVIQHAQSFKPRSTEERQFSSEALNHVDRSEPFTCDLAPAPVRPPHVPSTDVDPYLLTTDAHDSMEKAEEELALHPSQGPNFLGDFYSSSHLHSLYQHTEHHLSKDQLSKYLDREMLFPRDSENIQSFPGNKHSDSFSSGYTALLSEKEKMVLEDQPTDLSLPKSSPHKPPSSKPSLCGFLHNAIHQDVKGPSLFQIGSSHATSLDYHPKACRVPPMSVSSDPPQRAAGRVQNGRVGNITGHKMEELVRPVLSAKCSPQNVGAARPLKRSLEDLENGPMDKKIRVVMPLHSDRETAGKSKAPDPEDGGLKAADPVQAAHISSYVESHKFPLQSQIFPGFYPGTFLSQVQDMCDSLVSHIPTGYSHPLQYLKNQAVISPLVPPFAIHSLMMQRQLLASSGNPPPFYRHPIGGSYGDLLHHGLYPLSALTSQPSFSPPQLSSVHPSTKLS